jgi:hypothetical protein
MRSMDLILSNSWLGQSTVINRFFGRGLAGVFQRTLDGSAGMAEFCKMESLMCEAGAAFPRLGERDQVAQPFIPAGCLAEGEHYLTVLDCMCKGWETANRQ